MKFTVPLVPPSVNHYKARFRDGHTVVTREAKAFKEAVALCSRGDCVLADAFHVSLHIVLGAKQKGDVDNFPKLCLDGLADAGVFRDRKGKTTTDAHVRSLSVVIDCDTRPKHGYTEIEVEALREAA